MSKGCGGNYFVWIGSPDKGFGLLVSADDYAIDGSPEVDDALEDAALKAALGEDGEEAFDGVEDANELLVAVVLHAAADDLALQDIESGEQGGRTMAPVVMGYGPGGALLHRQARPGAFQSLYLRLLIDAQHHGVGGRTSIEADDVADLGCAFRIVGQLEGADAVQGQAAVLPVEQWGNIAMWVY